MTWWSSMGQMIGRQVGADWQSAGSYFGGQKEKEAAREARQDLELANYMARKMEGRRFRKAEEYMDPYMTAGTDALSQLRAQMGMGDGSVQAFDVTQLPGYQQALEQGLGAVSQGGAGAGMLMSGERLRGLQQAGQDVFGQYYGGYMQNLQNLVGGGQQAATNLGQMGLQSMGNLIGNVSGLAGQAADYRYGGGRASAAGLMGIANAQAAANIESSRTFGEMGGQMGGGMGMGM